MIYVEYAVSNGPGTLTEHKAVDIPTGVIELWLDESQDVVVETITPERYHEFLSIHGSERAV